MASFLTHLIQRTLAATPALTPRLTGRYEAPREAGQATLRPEEESVAGMAQKVQEPARANTNTESAQWADAGDPGARSALIPPVRAHTQATRHQAALARVDRIAPTQGLAGAHADAALPATHHALQWIEQRAQDAASPPASVHAARAPLVQIQPLPTQGAHGVESRVAVEVAATGAAQPPPTLVDKPSPTSLVPEVSPTLSTLPRPAQTGMLVEARLATESEPRPHPQQAPAAPTVHVTIGRIELRAAAPAPAPAPSRSAAKAPTLSLSDYLERRSKAGRHE